MLENLAFPDDVSSVFLIFIIVSDVVYLEMTLPSVSSCDFARTHPPFLASFRSLKNLKKKPSKKWSILHIKLLTNVSFLTPGDPRPLWTYISWVKSTFWMFRILGGPISISIAFAVALLLHYFILFSFYKIPCETFRIFGGPMSTSIAFAHDLSPICLTIFSFSNIPCGTCGILGGPISISIAFAHALFQLYPVLLTYCRFVSLCTHNPGCIS